MNQNSQNEIYLKRAVELYAVKRLASFPDEEAIKSCAYVPSAKFEKKMKKLLNRAKKPYYRLISTTGRRAAASVAAAVILLSVPVFSVKALRDPAVNFIVETFEKFSHIFFTGGHSAGAETIKTAYAPTRLPEGFLEVGRTEEASHIWIDYAKGEQHIFFWQSAFNSFHLADTENAETVTVHFGDRSGLFFTAKGYAYLYFSDGDGYFLLEADASLGRELLLEIAESVVAAEK
jgi:hypothetical protein